MKFYITCHYNKININKYIHMECENYLTLNINKYERSMLAKLRSGRNP